MKIEVRLTIFQMGCETFVQVKVLDEKSCPQEDPIGRTKTIALQENPDMKVIEIPSFSDSGGSKPIDYHKRTKSDNFLQNVPRSYRSRVENYGN